MKNNKITIGSRNVILNGAEAPEYLIIQMMDNHDLEKLESLVGHIDALVKAPHLHCSVQVDSWNRDLSPWPAPPVFGDEPFGDGADKTLVYIKEELLPALRETVDLSQSKIVLSGYSLAGLFCLWAAYQDDSFWGVAAASPSVWFPDWIQYASDHPLKVRHVSLSLGGKEAKTRNELMATVADCMDVQVELVRKTEGAKVFFEWNPGNHFKDPDLRTAKAIAALAKM
ncbi:MAG: esterase [Oscillospiraceae bacterium]|nr:esterase [Oscillospiraceae bacterium]